MDRQLSWCLDAAAVLRCQRSHATTPMPAKRKTDDKPLTGAALIRETCRRIRVARSYWDAHNNRACRGEREKAVALYETLTEAQREKVPQALRIWLRYRIEKYFGQDRTPLGGRPRP
jgi:hypothetical protein